MSAVLIVILWHVLLQNSGHVLEDFFMPKIRCILFFLEDSHFGRFRVRLNDVKGWAV